MVRCLSPLLLEALNGSFPTEAVTISELTLSKLDARDLAVPNVYELPHQLATSSSVSYAPSLLYQNIMQPPGVYFSSSAFGISKPQVLSLQ